MTDEERDALERWARRPTTAQALVQRARLVLTCARGRTNTRVARELHLTKQTAGSGGVDFWPHASTGFRMNRVLGHRTASPIRPWSRCDAHAEGETARGHPLEYQLNGRALRLEPEHGQWHLARLRPAAAPDRGLQAVEGPALRKEGAGYRRVLVVSRATDCTECITDFAEIYTPATDTWQALTDARLELPLYPHMFVLPDGRVIAPGRVRESPV